MSNKTASSSSNKNNDLYYSQSRNKIIEAQKKIKPVSFEIMIKEMRRRIENEKKRLEIIKLLGYTKIESNNIIPNENKYLSVTKTINKNQLNNMLSQNNKKRDAYIEILMMDLDEYFSRYKKARRDSGNTNNKIYSKINKVKNEIGKYIKDIIETKQFYNLKIGIKQILSNNGMPSIYFDLFRTRKGIKDLRVNRHMYNTNINHNYMMTNNNINIKRNLNLKISGTSRNMKIFNNIKDIIDFLGINKIVRFDGNVKEIAYNRLIYTSIAELITQKYMYEIDMPIEELQDPLFYRERDLYKLEISEKILSSFNSRRLYSSFSSKTKFSSGYVGIIFKLEDVILKYENLRFGLLNEKYIENYVSYYSPNSVSYLYNNYEVFDFLIQSLIQNYLYTLNKDYVQEFISYSVSYNDGLSLTRMRLSFDSNNKDENIFIGNFYDFIMKESNTEHTGIFIKNLLLILKELCIVLDFYQKSCYFVHGDLNIKNIMIKCKFDENHLVQDIKIKLIDFQFSSIILNVNNKLKILKIFGFGLRRVNEEFNPYISSYWNKIDILYFFASIVFDLKKIREKNDNIISFLSILLNIFNIKQDFYNKLVNNTKEGLNKYHSYIYSLKKEEKFSNIFIENKNKKEVFKNFIPFNLFIHLNKFINI
jgi:hypothetical protein